MNNEQGCFPACAAPTKQQHRDLLQSVISGSMQVHATQLPGAAYILYTHRETEPNQFFAAAFALRARSGPT